MRLVKQVQLNPSRLLNSMAIRSNNLYNYCLFTVRKHFFADGLLYSQKDLDKILKTSDAYEKLKEFGSQVPQQVLKQVLKSFKSFFNALKSYKRNPEKFKSPPKIPRYHKKGGKNILVFTSQQSRLQNGYILLPNKVLRKDFPKVKFVPLRNNTQFQSVRIVPYHDKYIFEIIYHYQCEELGFDENRKVGIDLGLNNFVSMSNNFGVIPMLIKGGVIKSINQYFNKNLAHYRSLAKKLNNETYTNRIKRLFRKRNNKIKDFFHKCSRIIINYCIENKVGEIIVGYNQGWKQNINIGKRNNQNFVSIPFNTLIKQLKYKGELVGIKIMRTSEEYTSQQCSQCGVIKKSNRKYRGLYVCSECGMVMNADINASVNIMQKGIPKSVWIGDRGHLNCPVCITV